MSNSFYSMFEREMLRIVNRDLLPELIDMVRPLFISNSRRRVIFPEP